MSKRTPRPPTTFDDYTPVALRARHDGWTPQRQRDFLVALSESACVDDACRAVGMTPAAAYRLRRRADAEAFRLGWDAALDYGIRRLGDVAISRALHGTARPIFYKGVQVGERRYYDERLTIFLLRHRDPVRYGAWRDRQLFEQHPDGPAQVADCYAEAAADPGAGRIVSDAGAFFPYPSAAPSTAPADWPDAGDSGGDVS